ncbi:MAG: AsmA-like C-terminal region-containing protein, partial [Parvularculaceae bacterium]
SDFTIVDGLVSTPSITLNGPYLTMTGSGSVNLGKQTIDLRLAPRASTSIDSSTGRMAAIPMRIGGTFAKPTIGIDAETLIKSGAARTLENVLKGKKKTGEDGAAEETEEDPAASLIKGVLGGAAKDKNAPDGADAEEKSVEKTLINEGINALLNKKKAQPAEPAKEETAEDAEPQN